MSAVLVPVGADDGRWHRVTSTFDRCEVRVYVHGKRQP